MVSISSPRPAKRPSLLNTLCCPRRTRRRRRAVRRVEAQSLQPRIGAMLVEIARDDAVLQHAAERQREAARRPGETAGDGDSWRPSSRAAPSASATAPMPRGDAAGGRDRSAQPERGGDDQRQQHREGRAVGGDRERDQRDERDALAARAARRRAKHQQIAAPARRGRRKCR